MNKDALQTEYEENGLTITDFHLGLRLAKPMFINTVMAVVIFTSYLLFLYTLYLIAVSSNNEASIILGLGGILVIFIARKLGKVIAYLYFLIVLSLLAYLLYKNFHPLFEITFVEDMINHVLVMTVVFSIFILSILSTVVVYRTNRNIIIKDGVLSIPASDVEQSLLAFVILKPFWGLFYRRSLLLEEIISVKNDGYGNKKEDIYPLTVTDVNSSNRLVFTSRQKRDEFRTKLSLLIGVSDSSGSSFGESE